MALYITSSRRPSIRTRTFIKELERVIPGSIRVVRGKKALEDLLELMIREGVSHLLIIDNVRGNPYSIRIYEAAPGLPKLLCRIYIKGVSLQVDVKRKRSISQLEIEDKCRSEESIRLAEVINAVIPETRYSVSRRGVSGKLMIECDEYLTLSFTDERYKVLYPVIRISRVEYEQKAI